MKQLLQMTILMSTLFMACNKDNSSYITPSNSTSNSASKPGIQPDNAIVSINNGSAGMSYELITLTPPGALVHWNAGYVTTSFIYLEGYQHVGNALRRGYYETKTGQTIPLFGATKLGTATIDPGNYYAMDLSIALSPSRGSAGGGAALYLTGDFNDINRSVSMPIQMLINEPLVLTTNMRSNTTINSGQSYTAGLLLDLSQITNGITSDMLAFAQRTNGVIVISANSNAAMYQTIVSNLKGDLRLRFQ